MLNYRAVLAIFIALKSLSCMAQSNIYSVAIYSGGTSYSELCALDFPFPPHHYELTQLSWREDANGLTIIDIQHKPAPGDVLRRSLEVKCGSESFIVPLYSVSPKKNKKGPGPPILRGSGDLAKLVMQCVTSRGGHPTTNALPVIQADWVRQARKTLDVIVVDGVHFAEIEAMLEQAYGAPDARIRPSSPVGNGRTLTYTPQQLGVVLIMTANSAQTIVSVLGSKKP